MKNIYKITLFLLAFMANTHLWANDTISFTWQASSSSKNLGITATSGKQFTVDWGDGTSETYTGNAPTYNELTHIYTSSDNYAVTLTGNTADCLFTEFACYSNQLNSLDISKASFLTNLNCSFNQLTTLDISKNTALQSLYCDGNSLPLFNLYTISQQIGGTGLGTQNLKTVLANLNVNYSITPDSILGGVPTQYIITKYGKTAVAGTDYELNGAQILFKTNGIYTIEMINNAITSSYYSPAKVIATFIAGTVEKQQITFTWQASKNSKSLHINTTEGKEFTIDWGDGTSETYTGSAPTYNDLIHIYTIPGNYAITLTGNTTDCLFIGFSCSNEQLTTLDVSKNTALTYLVCTGNQLTILDISKNTALQSLYCGNNALPLSNLYGISQQIGNSSLGTQNLKTVIANLNTSYSITPDGVLGGVFTRYKVAKNGKTAAAGIDYELNGAQILFKTNGIYTIEMTNDAISSVSYAPAKVIATFIAGTVEKQQITFTWKVTPEAKNFGMSTTFDKQFIINWGDGNSDTYTGQGYTGYSHVYTDVNNYTVSITGVDVDCFFTSFTNVREIISVLDISKATTLKSLDCSSDHLTTLDISKNTVLTYLNCDDNALTLSNLYAITHLQQIQSGNLGTQKLKAVAANLNTSYSITPDSVFGWATTQYVVTKNGETDIAETDYEINGSQIVFKTKGVYAIEMINYAISSSAKVIATFAVGVSIDATLKSLTTSKGNLTPAFASNMVDYTVDLPYQDSIISIIGLPTHNSATVAGNVTDKALAIGNNIIEITVTAEDKVTTQTYTVNVIRTIPVIGIIITPKELNLDVDSTKILTYEVLPANATNKAVTWESSNTAVASINNGAVTAKAVGTAYIIVTTQDGSFKDSCHVAVNSLGIDPISGKEVLLSVYPNPTNGRLIIESGKLKVENGIASPLVRNDEVQLFDLAGKLVATYTLVSEKTEINISHLPNGIYFVKVGEKTAKVIKK